MGGGLSLPPSSRILFFRGPAHGHGRFDSCSQRPRHSGLHPCQPAWQCARGRRQPHRPPKDRHAGGVLPIRGFRGTCGADRRTRRSGPDVGPPQPFIPPARPAFFAVVLPHRWPPPGPLCWRPPSRWRCTGMPSDCTWDHLPPFGGRRAPRVVGRGGGDERPPLHARPSPVHHGAPVPGTARPGQGRVATEGSRAGTGLVRTYKGHVNSFHRIRFELRSLRVAHTHHGRHAEDILCCGGLDGMVRLWSLGNSRPVQCFHVAPMTRNSAAGDPFIRV